MRQKLALIIPHTIFWYMILFLQALIVYKPNINLVPGIGTFALTFTNVFIGATCFYVHFHLSKKFIYGKFSWRWFYRTIIFILFISFIYYLTLMSMFGERSDFGIQYPEYYALPSVLFFSTSGMMFQGFHFSFGQRRRQQQLQTEKLSLELNLIRSQLNPHFLFNVLNNIDNFVRKDPDTASDSIIKLSELLRYLLYETSEPKVPLSKEIVFLEDYFHLQKQRLQQSAICSFEKNINKNDTLVAPAIFLPFIENAFIHCPLNEQGMFLHIKVSAFKEKIIFTVQNSKIHSDIVSSGEKRGLGIELTKKRLNILYPNSHQLNIIDAESFFLVELVIDIHEDNVHNS